MNKKYQNINEIKSYNNGTISPKNENIINVNSQNKNNNITLEKKNENPISTNSLIRNSSKENLNSNIDSTSSNNYNNYINNISNKLHKNIEKNNEKIMNQRGNLTQRTNDYKRFINPLIKPADPLIKRTIFPTFKPKFGKMKYHINLPNFIGNEPIIKFEYKPCNFNLQNQNEKMYEVNLYINSHTMLNKLVYLKTNLNKDGCIELENIVNVKKLNNSTSEDNNNTYNNINNKENKSSTSDILNNQNQDNLSLNQNNINNKHSNKNKSEQLPNDETLIFESRFESGNLLCAFKGDNDNSYQLYLQNDTNTTGYIQWFFFRVSNTKKGKKINFNIINMLRKNCLYQSGMKIMTYSTKQAEKENIGWHRDCSNIMYYPNNLYVFNKTSEKKRLLYSLSFNYEFKYDNDIVYFANSLPYFYSTLMKELNKYELDEKNYPFFHRKTLCSTLGGNDLDMFTLNSHYDIYNGTTSHRDFRKGIILIARQHPGETVGSYVMHGAMEFLLGSSDEAKKLRELYLIKVVPMMNPDGVLVGNSRTSFAGCDLNRRWLKPNEIIHPEIYYTKEMILKLYSQREIGFICDFHGHFGAFNSFFYCNFKDNKRLCSLFPFLCCKLSRIISYQQCNFGMPKFKYSTGRITLFNELNKENEIDGGKNNNSIVCLETSFFGVNRNGDLSRTYFTSDLMKEIGRDVCLGMLSYYYKYENLNVEKKFVYIDVDMNEFNDFVKDENESDDNKSESEPSIDNFDKEKIMKLLPTKMKGKKKGKKNSLVKKLGNTKRNNNRSSLNNSNIEIKLFNPLTQNLKPKTEEKNNNKNSQKKITINCDNKKEKEKNIIIDEPLRKDAQTQTEDIFFKMHWSYFAGEYPILQSKLNRNFISSAKKNFEMYRSKSQSDNIGYTKSFNLNNQVNTLKVFKGYNLNNNNVNNYKNNNNNNINNNINNNSNSNKFNSSFYKLSPLQRNQFLYKSKNLKKNSQFYSKGNIPYNYNLSGIFGMK